MKAMVFKLFLIGGLFLVGCSNDSSLVGPTGTGITNQTFQTQSDFISLPISSLNKSVESSRENSKKNKENGKVINGKKGGEINIEGKLNGVKYEAKLKIPKGAFEGTKKISIKFDGSKAAFDFSPNNSEFNKPLLFSAEIKGLDLNDINPIDVHFVFMQTNGTFVPVIYDKIKVDVKKGKLGIKNAQINHFSRYGWAK